jgi:di/tricarboxylate transporter
MEAGTTVAPNRSGSRAGGAGPVRQTGAVRRLTTETKQAFKTTEFWAMVGVVVAILVSAAAIKGGDTSGTDEFIARQAWLYVAIVAGAYLISRGLAKSGSSDPYTETDDDRNGSRH